MPPNFGRPYVGFFLHKPRFAFNASDIFKNFRDYFHLFCIQCILLKTSSSQRQQDKLFVSHLDVVHELE